MLDGIMLLWLILTALSLVFVVLDIHNSPASPVLKWGFVLITAQTGQMPSFYSIGLSRAAHGATSPLCRHPLAAGAGFDYALSGGRWGRYSRGRRHRRLVGIFGIGGPGAGVCAGVWLRLDDISGFVHAAPQNRTGTPRSCGLIQIKKWCTGLSREQEAVTFHHADGHHAGGAEVLEERVDMAINIQTVVRLDHTTSSRAVTGALECHVYGPC